jgi:hypothetical protein
VYGASGKPAVGVRLTVDGGVAAAQEVNFMEDVIAPVKTDGKGVTFDLGAFQIKTLSLRVGAKGP